MLVTSDFSSFAYLAKVCYNGDPFATLICETRRGGGRRAGACECGGASSGSLALSVAIPAETS
jgi:hypothetical protein